MLSLAGSMIGLWHVVVQICKFRSALGLLGLKCGIEIWGNGEVLYFSPQLRRQTCRNSRNMRLFKI